MSIKAVTRLSTIDLLNYAYNLCLLIFSYTWTSPIIVVYIIPLSMIECEDFVNEIAPSWIFQADAFTKWGVVIIKINKDLQPTEVFYWRILNKYTIQWTLTREWCVHVFFDVFYVFFNIITVKISCLVNQVDESVELRLSELLSNFVFKWFKVFPLNAHKVFAIIFGLEGRAPLLESACPHIDSCSVSWTTNAHICASVSCTLGPAAVEEIKTVIITRCCLVSTFLWNALIGVSLNNESVLQEYQWHEADEGVLASHPKYV
jgi:hypothetical protein